MLRNTLRLSESLDCSCGLPLSWKPFLSSSASGYEYTLEVKEHGLSIQTEVLALLCASCVTLASHLTPLCLGFFTYKMDMSFVSFSQSSYKS